jgi:hypothetical protein
MGDADLDAIRASRMAQMTGQGQVSLSQGSHQKIIGSLKQRFFGIDAIQSSNITCNAL